MGSLTRHEVAAQSGVDTTFVDRLIELGILDPGEGDKFVPGDVRRARMIQALDRSGLAVEDVAESVRRGDFRLESFDLESYEVRFSPLSNKTFASLATETGVPVELLLVIREAIGLAQASVEDHVRLDELQIVPALKMQIDRGFNPATIERWLRVYGDSLRRIADTEGAWWDHEILAPIFAEGGDVSEKFLDAQRWGLDMSKLMEAAVIAVYHAHQEHVWGQSIFDGVEEMLERAGLRNKFKRPPAMCFLDMTGYTRLTEERGDEAAADLAASMARMVQRTSREYGGKLVKWLGDGVMFFYRDPGAGVVAALQMLDGISDAGFPTAHVGIHAGPVVFQEGDYFGRTVNIAARIAAYARPGEVLVSKEVVEASELDSVTFTSIGPADLKGVSSPLDLFAARTGA